jgi:hypothetical protein
VSTDARITPAETRGGMSTYLVRLDGSVPREGALVAHSRSRALREEYVYCMDCKTERCPHADAVRHALLVANQR